MKPARHLDRIQMLRRGEQPFPVHLQISPSDLCNQDCNFCSYRASDGISTELFGENGNFNPKRMIPFEKMTQVLDDCVQMGVKAVQYQGGGEPTTHPKIFEIVRETVNRGIEVAMVTNGLKMSDEMMQLLVTRGSWIRVSLDAGTIETYAKIRNTPMESFNRVHRNVDTLVRMRDAIGSQLAISLGFVITRDNWEEITAAAHIAHELNVDMIRFTPAVLTGESGVPWREVDDLIAEARHYEIGERLKIYYSGSERRDGRPKSDFCGYQYFTPYLGGDQNLYRCCLTTYTQQGYIGSVRDQSLVELWSSYLTRQSMAGFKATQNCTHCKFREQNELIEYLTERNSRFENFV